MIELVDDEVRRRAEKLTGSRLERAKRLVGGIDFEVFRLDFSNGKAFVAKYARTIAIFNDNDGLVMSRDVLNHETRVLRHARAHGLPVPRVLDFSDAPGAPPFLLMDFVEGDGSVCDDAGVWRIAHEINSVPVLRGLAGKHELPASMVAAHLTTDRFARVRIRLASNPSWFPGVPQLTSLLLPLDDDRRLLHLDIRRANLVCKQGRVAGIVDWANARFANPLLEVARVLEYGEVGHTDIGAYLGIDSLRLLESPFGLACRLYTAMMLCVLFSSEIPDELMAARREQRLHELLGRLRKDIA